MINKRPRSATTISNASPTIKAALECNEHPKCTANRHKPQATAAAAAAPAFESDVNPLKLYPRNCTT